MRPIHWVLLVGVIAAPSLGGWLMSRGGGGVRVLSAPVWVLSRDGGSGLEVVTVQPEGEAVASGTVSRRIGGNRARYSDLIGIALVGNPRGPRSRDRVDLEGVDPNVWSRLELPSDWELPGLDQRTAGSWTSLTPGPLAGQRTDVGRRAFMARLLFWLAGLLALAWVGLGVARLVRGGERERWWWTDRCTGCGYRLNRAATCSECGRPASQR